MDTIDKNELASLIREQQWPAISIYMPVSRIGDQQDPIRYKNFLGRIENRLISQGMRAPEARNLLEPEYQLVQDHGYWKHIGKEGLAVFRSEEVEVRYSLPISFQELIQVGHRFHIKPLIPLLNNERYLVLALNKSGIRLFRGDRFLFREIELPEDTPKSMAEVLKYDYPERQLQYHTKTSSAGDRRGAMFHGQGVGIDEEKVNMERYFQAVDRSLFPKLDEQKCPIILAGIDELSAIYRRISKSHALLEDSFTRNAGDLTAGELHARTWELAASYFSRGEQEAVNIFRNKLGTGLVVEDLQSVLTAACQGRVETLFVVGNEQVWGLFDTGDLQMVLKNQNDGRSVDLLDEAVFLTLCKKGKVFIKERQDMPVDTTACAYLRF